MRDRAQDTRPRPAAPPLPPDPLAVLLGASRAAGHGLYLGAGSIGPVFAPPEHGLLVLGPPRSGKTSGVVIPNILAACGSTVVASTKTDLLTATLEARARLGPVLAYDPSGTLEISAPLERIGWSPLTASATWNGALLIAGAMVGAARPGAERGESAHWNERAQALLATLFHAAALAGSPMSDLIRDINARSPEGARATLARSDAELASDLLTGILATDSRELSGIWSTTSSVLAGYRSEEAIASCDAPVLDSRAFLERPSTLYIAASGEQQGFLAPLVAGVVREIRTAAYERARVLPSAHRLAEATLSGSVAPLLPKTTSHPPPPLPVSSSACVPSSREKPPTTPRAAPSPRSSPPPPPPPGRHGLGSGRGATAAPVLLVLDECANIAPLHDLPRLVAEGGSQGLVTLACLQDLSQARARWGIEADGFLSLFGYKMLLPGIADTTTLEAVSLLAGDFDSRTLSVTSAPETLSLLRRRGARNAAAASETVSTRRLARLPPDAIARGRPGSALVLCGVEPVVVGVRPWFTDRLLCGAARAEQSPKLELCLPPPSGERHRGLRGISRGLA